MTTRNKGSKSKRSRSSSCFTPSELRKLRSFKTPAGIQKFLDDLPYNLSYDARSPKKVLHDRTASCLEGGIFAAAALRMIGFAPLIFDLEAEQDTDHVIAIFKVRGHWGAVAKSNFTGCRYREPVYRTLRERFGQHRVHRSPHPFGSIAIGLAIHLAESNPRRIAEKLTRHIGVFREAQAGRVISCEVLLAKDTPLPPAGAPPLEVKRRYRPAHNIGHFRYFECAHGLSDVDPHWLFAVGVFAGIDHGFQMLNVKKWRG